MKCYNSQNMQISNIKNYKTFWGELSDKYPISKGRIRLPIATKIIDLNEFISRDDMDDLKNYLQKKLMT